MLNGQAGKATHWRLWLQRLVDELGSTLVEVIEAPAHCNAEVTGVTIFDTHEDLLLSPGDLLLGVGVVAEHEIVALLRQLGALRAAALLVKTPSQVSDATRDAVRASGVPLVGLTQAASWFDVAVLLGKLLDRRANIGDAYLGDSPAGDLFAFANAVSALVDAPVTVEDRSSRVIAFSGRQEEADQWRVKSILGRHTPSSHSRMLKERGIFRELYRSERPIHVQGLDPDALPRVAVAVRAGAEVLGSLWVVAKEPLSEERLQALSDAARLAALHMLHERNAADFSRQLCADLLEEVLSGGSQASHALIRLGLTDGPLCVLACQPLSELGTVDFESVSHRLADSLALHLGAFYSGLAVARIGHLVYAVVSLPDGEAPQVASRRVQGHAASFVARVGSREPVYIGIGGPALSRAGLVAARAEAEQTVRVLRDNEDHVYAARFDDVYLEILLSRLSEVLADDEGRSRGPVGKLLDYDARNGTELTATLRAYLEAPGAGRRAAAEAVHVHPNTFRYRMRRIREISELDFSDPRTRLAALVQLNMLRRSVSPLAARRGREKSPGTIRPRGAR